LEYATVRDLDLMGLFADVAFTYDIHGRMLRTNEPREVKRRPAPRLFLGSTVDGLVRRFGALLTEALVQRLNDSLDSFAPPSDLHGPLSAPAGVLEALEQHAPIVRQRGGPIYRFPESVARPREAVELTERNIDLARATYPWLLSELADWWPCFVGVRDDAAVSVCFSARIGPRVAVASLDTLPAFRGRGYAAAVTAAWGAAVRDSGRIPIYNTTWDNVASQAVARRLRLVLFGVTAAWA
jgi:hypothetical protein